MEDFQGCPKPPPNGVLVIGNVRYERKIKELEDQVYKLTIDKEMGQ